MPAGYTTEVAKEMMSMSLDNWISNTVDKRRKRRAPSAPEVEVAVAARGRKNEASKTPTVKDRRWGDVSLSEDEDPTVQLAVGAAKAKRLLKANIESNSECQSICASGSEAEKEPRAGAGAGKDKPKGRSKRCYRRGSVGSLTKDCQEHCRSMGRSQSRVKGRGRSRGEIRSELFKKSRAGLASQKRILERQFAEGLESQAAQHEEERQLLSDSANEAILQERRKTRKEERRADEIQRQLDAAVAMNNKWNQWAMNNFMPFARGAYQ